MASATDKVTGKLIIATVKQISHLKQVINTQRGLMAQECSVPEVDLLKSFIGIKDFSAIGLMLEIETGERFYLLKNWLHSLAFIQYTRSAVMAAAAFI